MHNPDFFSKTKNKKNCSSIVGTIAYWTSFMLGFSWTRSPWYVYFHLDDCFALFADCENLKTLSKKKKKNTTKTQKPAGGHCTCTHPAKKMEYKARELDVMPDVKRVVQAMGEHRKSFTSGPVQFSGAWWQNNESDAVTPSPTLLHDKHPFNTMSIPDESAYVNAWCAV